MRSSAGVWLAALKPWFVSITVMNLQMMSAGFQPQYGLEQFLTGLARRDNKPIEGLETMEYQLGVFDGLSEKTQTRMLLQTLDEAADLDSQLDVLTKEEHQSLDDALAGFMARVEKGEVLIDDGDGVRQLYGLFGDLTAGDEGGIQQGGCLCQQR